MVTRAVWPARSRQAAILVTVVVLVGAGAATAREDGMRLIGFATWLNYGLWRLNP